MQVITIYNPKGGVGKTALAFALTKELDDCYYVTNDKIGSCITLDLLKNTGQYIDKKITTPIGTKTIIFDAGGFVDSKIEQAIKSSKIIVIPITLDNANKVILKKLFLDIKSKNSNAKIIVIINKFDNQKFKKNDFLNEISGLGDFDEIFFLRETGLFEKIQVKNKSINQFVDADLMSKFIYRNLLPEWNQILDYIKK
jgi:cellulose biosynthesis protein BcsQ